MDNQELQKVIEQLEAIAFKALEKGATKEEVVKQLDYVKHEVENLADDEVLG